MSKRNCHFSKIWNKFTNIVDYYKQLLNLFLCEIWTWEVVQFYRNEWLSNVLSIFEMHAKKSTSLVPIVIFFSANMIPYSWTMWWKLSRRSLWLDSFGINNKISSMYTKALSMIGLKIFVMAFWNRDGAIFRPNSMTVHWEWCWGIQMLSCISLKDEFLFAKNLL